jgi:hypothetical protein
MHGRHLICLAALLAVGAQALQAQQAKRYTPVFGFNVGAMAIEPGVATANQIGDRSFGIQLDAGVLLNRFFYLGADFGGQFLDDKAQFTQNTTAGEKESTANVTYLSAMAGLRTPTPRVLPVALALNVGMTATMSRRSIDQCVDCDVDKLDVPGGAFVEPTLLVGRRNARLRVTDRVYLDGKGMQSIISVGLDYRYEKKK